ncbi:hypothetical protein FBX98_101592 [Burkholderia sp. SJZ115]|nr:hypothetical protein FB600_101592 [Burkholderia sp. SJZ089]TWD09225.1 hypothetical protein FBX98_101592 [Burkholderia sp. SJZ115]TWD12360.1 hypothetical protein FB601_101593 [Burkholderia sp. SJZ091]
MKNAIASQTGITVIPNVTSVQNIGEVDSRGVELSYQHHDVGLRGPQPVASLVYTQSTFHL